VLQRALQGALQCALQYVVQCALQFYVFACVAICCYALQSGVGCGSVLQRVAACCCVLPVCCCVLQYEFNH